MTRTGTLPGMVKQYGKFIAQVFATFLAAISTALAGDGHMNVSESLIVVTMTLGAIGVLGAGNLRAGVWHYTKTIVSAATAGVVAIQSSLTDGVSQTEWLMVALAVLGAVGVFAVKGPEVRTTQEVS